MITVTTDDVAGYRIVKVYGLVEGNTVRARNLARDIVAVVKSLFGGEISEYSELVSQGREQATQRMTARAEALGANAVLNVRITTAMIMNGATELLAYGTAVTLEADD